MGYATDDLNRRKDITTNLVDSGNQIEEEKAVELQKRRPTGKAIGPYGPLPSRKGLGGNFDVKNMLGCVTAPGQLPGGEVIADRTSANYAQPD